MDRDLRSLAGAAPTACSRWACQGALPGLPRAPRSRLAHSAPTAPPRPPHPDLSPTVPHRPASQPPEPGRGRAPRTCDPARVAAQPPARLGRRVRAQAVADEVHVLGAVAQHGLRTDGASGPAGGRGCAHERGAGRGLQIPEGTPPARPAGPARPDPKVCMARGPACARGNSADQRPRSQLQAARAGTRRGLPAATHTPAAAAPPPLDPGGGPACRGKRG